MDKLPEEVEEALGQQMLIQAELAAGIVALAETQLKDISAVQSIFNQIFKSGTSEIWITDETGKSILHSPNGGGLDEFVFLNDSKKQPHASQFYALLEGTIKSVNQPFDKQETDQKPYKYVGVGGMDKSRIVQIGYNLVTLDNIRKRVGFGPLVNSLISTGSVNSIWLLNNKMEALASALKPDGDTSNDYPSERELDLAAKVIETKEVISDLKGNTLIVMSPLQDKDNNIVGVVFMQLPADILNQTVINQILIGVAVSLAVLLFSFLAMYRSATNLSRPIAQLSDEAKKIEAFDLSGEIDIHSNVKEVHALAQSMKAMKTSLQSFGKYVPRTLVKQLMNSEEGIELGGDVKKLTIMFSDVANFTTVSERMPPEKLMHHVSHYFEHLTTILMANNATIDKYIGDAIMAFWGAPLLDEMQATNACRGSLLCQYRLKELNRVWTEQDLPPLVTRMGINTGEVVVGNMGSSERMNYTAIGDPVNLAARLEGVNKLYGTNVIISKAVYTEVSDLFLARPLDIVAVKGKDQGIEIYELVGEFGHELLNPTEEQRNFCAEFGEAIQAYRAQKWADAKKMFAKLQKVAGEDNITIRLYLERCDYMKANPPGSDWDGVTHLKSK